MAMQYALLFYNPPHTLIPASEREATIAKMLAEMGAWRDELQRAGVFRTDLRLAPVDAATSLRSQGGDVLVTDGPSPRPRRSSAGWSWSSAPTSTRRSAGRGAARSCGSVRSKYGRSSARPADGWREARAVG
jgi:hypothetical protein